MKHSKLAVIAGLVAGLVTGFGYAAEVSSDDALCAVKGWVSLKESLDKSIEGNPASVETYTGRSGKGKFYVVTLEGGGYVVASGDDEVTPILAYSKSGTFEASEKNPLWCLLAGRAAIEADRIAEAATATGGRRLAASASGVSGNAAKWSRLRAAGGANGGKTRLGGAPSAAPTDLRVPELLHSDWSQGRIGNYSGTDYPYCFNMYTPEINGERAPCGCVATSGSQIMRYFQYPTASVTAQTKTCTVGGVDTSLTMMGGTYDWANMPTNINSMYNQPEADTLAYRQAIGKLTYDVGVAVGMSYTANGSGASVGTLANALVNVFGYRKAAYFFNEGGLAADKLRKAVIPNLDAKRPCGIGIANTTTEEGHAIVADGYGYSDDTLYIHFNMGWNNLAGSNAWYTPPDFDVREDIQYDVIDEVICNIFTDTGSEFGSIASGRVLDGNGNPIPGATVTGTTTLLNGVVTNIVTTSDERGIYAIILPAVENPCTIKATADDGFVSSEVTFTIASTDISIGNTYDNDITLTEKPKPSKLLDFIESTGAQYIDTGVEAKMGTKAALDIMWTAVTGWDVEMFSANGAGNTNYKLLDGSASGSFYIYPTVGSSSFFVGKSNLSNWPYSANFVTYANNTRYRVSVGISTDGVYSLAINGGAYTQSGTATKSVGTIAASGRNFYLFGCNNNGTASNYSDTKARCYGTKIWQVDGSGEYKLVRDFLPCLDSDGVACLYDTVSKELFYSKTVTPFTAGNELSDFGTPDAILEYVDSTGAQYIDTGVEARAGTKSEMKMQWKAYRSGYNLDAYLSATSGSGKFYLCELNYERWWCAAFGSWEKYVSSSYITGSTLASYMNLNTDYTVVSEVNQAKTWSMSFGGGSASVATGQSLNTLDVNFYMFACNSSGTAANHATARCYYTKIWQMDADWEYRLVRDFVPCRKDGIAGLYDKVSGTIFKSKTDTALTAGPVSAELPDKFVEYVYSDGRQYVDTGVEAKMGTKAALDIMWTAVSGTEVEMFSANGAGNTYYWMLDGYASGSFYVRPNIQSSGGFWVSKSTLSNWPYSGNYVTYAQNTRYSVSVGISTDGVYSFAINGGVYTQSGTATKSIGAIAASGRSFYLFGCNKNGTASNYSNTKARCYGTKIWQVDASGEYKIVRDFKPCVKGGRPGLYDAVSGRIFYSGSGTDLLVGENTEVETQKFWTDFMGDGSFDNLQNWWGGELPVENEDVTVYPKSAAIVTDTGYSLGTVNVPVGTAVFGGGSGAITMKGLTIASGATAEITGAEGLVDGGVSGAGTLVINPGVGNTFTMTKNNTGFTGSAVIKSGKVKFGDRRSFGARPANIRVKGGATLDESNVSDTDYNGEKNIATLDAGAILVGNFNGGNAVLTTLTLEGDATVDTSSGPVSISQAYNWALTHINLGANTLTKTGANDFYISCSAIAGAGTFDIVQGKVVATPTCYGHGNSSTTCSDGTINIHSGATFHLKDVDKDGDKVTLSVKNLVLDGSVTKGTTYKHMLTVTGTITGKGTTPMLTMGSGAKFKPNGTDFLTITDSLSGTMTIDVSELVFTDRKDDIPLFKVGNASILPAKGDVVVNGELPVPWRLTTTPDGLGYRLNRTKGTMIVVH